MVTALWPIQQKRKYNILLKNVDKWRRGADIHLVYNKLRIKNNGWQILIKYH